MAANYQCGGDPPKETSGRFSEYLPEIKQKELRDIANAIVAPGKGILAADESVRKPFPMSLITFGI